MDKGLISIFGKNDIIVNGGVGVGKTTLTLALLNEIAQEKSILYYNPDGKVDRRLVEKYYKNVYSDVFFMVCPLKNFIEYIIENSHLFDIVVVDPGDILLLSKKLIHRLHEVMQTSRSRLICTSQLRIDPNKGGKPYSTLEEFNKTSIKLNKHVFKCSIWIRNATAPNPVYKLKYVDIFDSYRVGNNYEERYIIKTMKGYVV